MTHAFLPTAAVTPLVIPGTHAICWIVGSLLLALLGNYFVGVNQRASSELGSDTHMHEFVHDARHLLGFPWH